MAKILLAFFAGTDYGKKDSAIGPFYESFITALQARGHKLMVMAHPNFGAAEWGRYDASLAREIKNFNPDLCIIFNNSFWDISDLVNCPILIYASDSVLYFANQSRIKNNPARYLFIVDKSSKKVLVEKFGVKEEQISLSIPFSGVKPQEMPLEQNIVFIGSKFISQPVTPINFFLKENPTDGQRKEFMQALNYLKKNPFADPATFINEKIVTSELVLKYFNTGYWIMQLSDEKRIAVLSAISDLGLTLYGTPNWTEFQLYNFKLSLSYSAKRVKTLAENSTAYNASKIGISVGHLQAVDGFPWRTLDIMQSNACLVSDYHKDFDKLFPNDLFPIYKDAYDAREICKELLGNEKKRKKIVKRCQEYAFKKFGFERVAKNINALIGDSII